MGRRVALAVLAAGGVLAVAACGGGGRPAGVPGEPSLAPGSADGFANELLLVSRDGWRTDFSRHTVPLIQFTGGGPGKDGIPAIDEPRFESVAEAGRWLAGGRPLIEVRVGGETRGYPLAILVWHEIVNDEVGGTPVAVTFCPLCNTALAFERTVGGRVLDFGTTGNLRFSNLVMYDRRTESWWLQFTGEAVVGELAGAELRRLPARIVSWADFRARHPEALVLSRETGHQRPYGANPYPGYDDVEAPPLFGTPNQDDPRVPAKERVVFVERGGEALAVPYSTLERDGRIEAEVGGERLVVEHVPGVRSPLGSREDAAGRIVGSAIVRTAAGEAVPFDSPFWFAVAAYRPDVSVWGGRSQLPRPEPPPLSALCGPTSCSAGPGRTPRRRRAR